jgi:starch-binding outer membrane protein, SusD/RagB family
MLHQLIIKLNKFTLQKRTSTFAGIILCLMVVFNSCKKAVEIDEPVNTITTYGAFSTEATATSAVTAIYSNLINTGSISKFGNGIITAWVGLSSDELSRLNSGGDILEFKQNNLLPTNQNCYINFWSAAYFSIYQTNACIEALQNSVSISADNKARLIGECKFLRAYVYFYLVNLWGDIPMPLTSDWRQTVSISRTSKDLVYKQIIEDLKEAQNVLPQDYSVSGGERIRANKFAATALLSRVHLYQKDWVNAELLATSVIDKTSLFNLNSNLNDVYLKNSDESILQMQPGNTAFPFAVTEQYFMTGSSLYHLTNELLGAFETGDQRRIKWVSSRVVSGTTYYHPAKYKVRQGTAGGNLAEYYMVLRLAEQYLIRAEARAQQNKVGLSQDDLNVIRSRAGLTATIANDQASLLLAIEHERQIELFAEWAHRWFDLVRTERATAVLGPIKGTNWQATDVLFPIPQTERLNNILLTQNPGY